MLTAILKMEKKNRIAINIGASHNTATNFIKQKYKRYKEMSLETL